MVTTDYRSPRVSSEIWVTIPAEALQDAIERIAAMEQLSRQRRQDLCSAVRKIAGLLGRRRG